LCIAFNLSISALDSIFSHVVQISRRMTWVGGTWSSWFTPACKYWLSKVLSSSFC